MLGCLLCGLLAFPARGEGILYSFDELGMSIEIPEGYVALTRDMDPDDPVLEAFGFTKEELDSLMEEQDAYFTAWDEDVEHEIGIFMIETPYGDFDQYSDSAMSTIITGLTKEFEVDRVIHGDWEIYSHSQARFLKVETSWMEDGEEYSDLRYFTACNGKMINMIMTSYSGPIGAGEEEILKAIVDSARFTDDSGDSEAPVSTSAPPDETPEYAGAFGGQEDQFWHSADQKDAAAYLWRQVLLSIFVSLIITVSLYSLPIFIYRFGIRKAPVEKKKAKRITIIYGICAFLVMSALLLSLGGDQIAGSAILLWSFINYRVLTAGGGGTQSKRAPSYCRICGNKLAPGNTYCDQCGAKVEKNVE